MYGGAMFAFIRLSGCSVGKPFPKEMYQPKMDPIEGAHKIPGLPIYTEMCTLYDGRTFACDTDYRVKERLTLKQIFDRIPEDIKHICITGGEPFIHNLNPFLDWTKDRESMLHVETSGTIPLIKAFPNKGGTNFDPEVSDVWITVSPKFGVLPAMVKRADEIKILIDEYFTPRNLIHEILEHERVYIQPVNGEWTVDKKNLALVMDWQKKYPHWRVSLQLHKVLSHYLGELVR